MATTQNKLKIGKEYIHNGTVKHCSSGYHFCENPMDVFGYYPPGYSRYTEVEGTGKISREGIERFRRLQR